MSKHKTGLSNEGPRYLATFALSILHCTCVFCLNIMKKNTLCACNVIPVSFGMTKFSQSHCAIFCSGKRLLRATV